MMVTQNDVTDTVSVVSQVNCITLDKLKLSPDQMRKGKTVDDEFVASIRINGVIQPLLVDPQNNIAAGRRRYLALKKLEKAKIIEANFPVPCIVRDSESMLNLSIAENLHREPPHPTEYHSAIKKLSKTHTRTQICSQLRISPYEYDCYIRLSNLHPKILKAYASGKLSGEQAKAFGATTNKKRQLEIWESADFSTSISAYQIKRHIHGEVTSRSPLAIFVGLAKYQEVGGKLSHDLFDDIYTIHDTHLLESLAHERLKDESEKLQTDEPEWKWIEIQDLSDTTPRRVANVHPPKYRKITAEDKALIDEMEAKLAPYYDIDDDEITPEQDREFDDLSDALERLRHDIDQRRRYYSKAQMKSSGVVIAVDNQGNLKLNKGLQTKSDIATPKGSLKTNDADKPTGTNTYSQSVTTDMMLLKRSFTKAQLLKNPTLSIDLLHFSLLSDLYCTGYVRSFHALRTDITNDETPSNGYSGSIADTQITTEYRALPLDAFNDDKSISERFDLYTSLPEPDKRKLLVYASAVLLDNDCDSIIEVQTKLNIRDYWTPSVDYFKRLGKPHLIEIATELVGRDKAQQMSSDTRKIISEKLADLFVGGPNLLKSLKEWVPTVFTK